MDSIEITTEQVGLCSENDFSRRLPTEPRCSESQKSSPLTSMQSPHALHFPIVAPRGLLLDAVVG